MDEEELPSLVKEDGDEDSKNRMEDVDWFINFEFLYNIC